MSKNADDFVTLYVTRPSPIHLPVPRGDEAKRLGMDQPGASGVDKDMLLPGANRVRRDFIRLVADNPGLKIFWRARVITFDPPEELRMLGDLRAKMEEHRMQATETTGPSATQDNPFAGKSLPECLAFVETCADASALSRYMDLDPRNDVRTAIARRIATLGSGA